MTLRPLVTGLLAASTLIVVFASPALAECMTWPRHATERLQVGYAFSGTVVDVAKSLYSEEGSPLYRWVVSVEVEHVYRGRVPERVQLEGTDWGCSFLRVSSLTDGDRVFIASERLRPALTDETDLGNVLAWKQTGGRWVFHDHGLQEGSDPDYYPAAARTAKTTRDIVRLISGAALPDTSTQPLDRRSNLASLPLLGVIFASSLGLLLLRRSRRA
jgi:hypothetical protein